MLTICFAPCSTFPSAPARTSERVEFVLKDQVDELQTFVGLHVKYPLFNRFQQHWNVLTNFS
jgi:hypothetical protein